MSCDCIEGVFTCEPCHIEQASTRIRELEAFIANSSGTTSVKIALLEQRIATTKLIIMDLWIQGHLLVRDRDRVLETLEGK